MLKVFRTGSALKVTIIINNGQNRLPPSRGSGGGLGAGCMPTMPGGAQTNHTQLGARPSPDFMDRIVNFVNRMFWVSGNSPSSHAHV